MVRSRVITRLQGMRLCCEHPMSIDRKKPLRRRLSQDLAGELLVEVLEAERPPRLWCETDAHFARG